MDASTANGAGAAPANGKAPQKDTRKRHDGPPKTRALTLEDLDRRTNAYRRSVEMADTLVAERGGRENLSTARYAMTQTVAVLSAMVEDLQVRWLRGDQIDVTEIVALINARRREAEAIGLDPLPRDVTPNLREYLASEGGTAPVAGPLVNQAQVAATPAEETE